MIILIFVHDTHKNSNKCISCQIFLYFTRYAGLSKALMASLVVFVVKEYVFQSLVVECLYGKFGY